MRADAMGRDRVEEQRVTVGVRFGDAGCRGRSSGAAAIYDDDGLPDGIGKLGADHPGHEVGSATRGHRDHDLDLTGRICQLRICRIRPDKRSDDK